MLILGRTAQWWTTKRFGHRALRFAEPGRVFRKKLPWRIIVCRQMNHSVRAVPASVPRLNELLLAALGSCTSMTLGMYAKRKNWQLDEIIVRLRHSRIHAEDCSECETKLGFLDRIELELTGRFTLEQRSKLLETAEKCPAYRTLESEVNIRSSPREVH